MSAIRHPRGMKRGSLRPHSAWHKGPYGPAELLVGVDLCPAEVYTPKPKGYRVSCLQCLAHESFTDKTAAQRSESIPEHPLTGENLFILSGALQPILLQTLSYKLFRQKKWPLPVAFLVYHISFLSYARKLIARMHHAMRVYGTFDEEVRSRDLVPDSKVKSLAVGSHSALYRLLSMTFLRRAGYIPIS